MQRMQLAIGTRAEVLAELGPAFGADAAQAGKADKARAYAIALKEIEGGDSVAVVLVEQVRDGEPVRDPRGRARSPISTAHRKN